jgi:hypothetical protein
MGVCLCRVHSTAAWRAVGSSAAVCVVQHVTDCVREMDGARDFSQDCEERP